MDKIKTLQLIHTSFLAGVTIFATVACVVKLEQLHFDFSLTSGNANVQTLSFVAIIFMVLAMNLGTFLFKKILQSTPEHASASERFTKYQTAFLVKYALLESSALFSVVLCLLTGNFYFIIVASFALIAMLLMRPTKQRVYETLQLQETDHI